MEAASSTTSAPVVDLKPKPNSTTDQKETAVQLDFDALKAKYDKIKSAYNALKKEESAALRKYRQESEIRAYAAELIKLQHYLETHAKRMIVVVEGRDAAGKGSVIRRLTRFMNQKHCRVVALGKPTEEQRTQWFFQKYISQFPRGGEVVVFDRSWYNRAMVEPVFNFCTEEEHQNFMRGVVGFEKDLVRQGTILIKLYLSVSKEEQAKRFEVRHNDPLEQWKLSEVDLQAQEMWEQFSEVKYEMLKRTHTSETPWTIVRSDHKHLARLNAIRVILNTVPYENRDTNLNYVPDKKVIRSGALELERLTQQRIKKGHFVN
ncbi:MAG: polyphosphate kinase 2 [Magnetococcales bacterium]|nr:polyphosphate kinase 2 [Magnetococcales bacterium]